MSTTANPEPVVPPAVLGRSAATVRTSAGLAIRGELAEQHAGWLRIRGSAAGAVGASDWWLPIPTITAIEVSGDA